MGFPILAPGNTPSSTSACLGGGAAGSISGVIRTATPSDLSALRDLFARSCDAPYDLATVAEEKCFGLGIGGEPVVRVIGNIDAAAVTCGRWLRILVVDRGKRRSGLGSALLADAEAHGAHRIAAEPGNYFTPGIVTTDEASIAFFKARGYSEGAKTTNLDVDLSATRHLGDSATRAERSDAPRVLAFIEKEFGRIWRFEVAHAFDAEEPTIFVAEQDGKLSGFAAHEVNNRGLGWFGPTGVSHRFRGRGIGRDLLLASLADLRRLGYAHAVIPWTDAIEFYRKSCGASAAYRFVAFEKPRP